ncbi:hypothetical protein FIBSPDRAFT_1047213 [Athelia psychrophila]|uniref:Elongator complex protein 5 n=1 Tax=Athelia psychrophila TaxID=1759441 RepID=A0A166FLH5_9AGAM|nr:hypothetical protein FIBSPDRAFT_1047213 [Fibularhizoctonia sp. CBS 109695]
MFDFDLSFSAGECVLITSQLAAPGDFVLHRALAAHFKNRKNEEARCVVVSIAGDSARWKAVAAKSNVDLGKLMEAGKFTFLDPLPLVPAIEKTANLQAVYDALTPLLTAHTLLIITDLAALEWIGIAPIALTRFIRAIKSLASRTASTLLFHHPLLPPETDAPSESALLRTLMQVCEYHVDVLPLKSGPSGSVSGEISLHLGPTGTKEGKHIPRSAAIQYRLTDTGAVFFGRGTGGGVL